MAQGHITKIVKTFGSTWGRIKPQDGSHEVFFNAASLRTGVDFAELEIGQAVEFEEVADQVNGTHAERLVAAVPA